jgi:cell division septum initiation protein DivIVA
MTREAEEKARVMSAAAEQAGEQTRSKAQEQADAIVAAAEEKAKKVEGDARREADSKLQEARTEAVRLGEEARREAAARVADAEQAAEDMLADAKAVSAGLRALGRTLSDSAEKILRDVQTGHKRIRGDLRTVTGTSSSPAAEPESRRPSRRAGGGVFDDLEVPSWAEKSD